LQLLSNPWLLSSVASYPPDLLGVICARLEEIQALQQEAALRAANGTSGMGLAAAVSATSGGLTSSQVGRGDRRRGFSMVLCRISALCCTMVCRVLK
jgi:hypothetical protein